MNWLDDGDGSETCQVVVNDEEQYAFWPTDREPPAGWKATGTSGTRSECERYVREVWTDMRPRALRATMQAKSVH